MAQAADRASFEALAMPELDVLYASAQRLTRDPALADDLVQETMMRAYRAWGSFSPGTSVRAWLLTIMRNAFITEYHRSKRRLALARAVDERVARDGAPAASGRVDDPFLDPETGAVRRETAERVHRALDALTPEFRETIALADLDGLSYKEIAQVTGAPVGTVMSRLHRARKALYKALFSTAQAEARLDGQELPSEPISLAVWQRQRVRRA